MTKTENETVTIRVTYSVRKALRIMCAEQEKTISEVIQDLINSSKF